MIHVRLSRDASLDHDVFDFAHDFVDISALGVEYFEDGEHGSFVALLFLFAVVLALLVVVRPVVILIPRLLVVLPEVVVHFVDRVVRQVTVDVVQVVRPRLLVGLCRKPGKPLLMNIDSQRVQAVEQHVDSQIVFQVLDGVR